MTTAEARPDEPRIGLIHYYGGVVGGEHRVIYRQHGRPDTHPLPPRYDLREHSPTGFAWGYSGSGPAQLALALVAHELGDQTALSYYQAYKRAVVARLPKAGWSLTSNDIRVAVDRIMVKSMGLRGDERG
jgi:hypothetical protein